MADATHNATQYVLAYVTERWYFTLENDEGVKEDLSPLGFSSSHCLLLGPASL